MKPAADRDLHRRRMFWSRMILHSSISVSLLCFSMLAGMIGYRHFEHLSWTDAFVNAAMILSGMGPMKTDLSQGGKVFAGLYALYSGIVVIAVAGLLLAPAIHRVMHRVHWDDQS
ncbi:MAG TPA: hypothetical protein VMS54_04385 [Vicinamibacterales bacterium]|nr:hypothetical protein [Vicinamibacterales bacterium]